MKLLATVHIHAKLLYYLGQRSLVWTPTRARLGCYSRGAGGTELVYARDSMAQPLRDLNRVLEQVREGQFDPDATRSGYFPNSARAPVSEQPELSSSSEGSED